MNNITLNNGKIAVFLYFDEFSRPVYKLESGVKAVSVGMDGTELHTISPNFGEPEYPLCYEYQMKEEE